MKLLCKLFGHKYEPRFSIYLGPPTPPDNRPPTVNGVRSYTQALEFSRERRDTYICDICARCGEVINMRQDAELDLDEMMPGPRPESSKFETVHSES